MKELLFASFRGIGQVMFQRNALSGVLMLIGLAIGSWRLALLAFSGSIVGTICAKLLRCPNSRISDGLYGYNSALSGLAVGVFFSPGLFVLGLFFGVTILSAAIAMVAEKQQRLPVLTAPFVFAIWLTLAIAKLWNPETFLPTLSICQQVDADWIGAFCLSIGQVMFEGVEKWSGILFFLGIAVNSRENTFYAVFGGLLPLAVGFLLTDFSGFNVGLFGYNAVLSAIALGGKSWKSFVTAALAVVLSVGWQWLGMESGIVTLTAPFVVSVWFVVAMEQFKQAVSWNKK